MKLTVLMRSVRAGMSLVVVAALSSNGHTQAPKAEVKAQILIHAAHALDIRSGRYLPDVGILIVGDRIHEVGAYGQMRGHPAGAQII